MDLETRKNHLFNTVKAHTMKHPQDAVLFLAVFTDDKTNYKGPAVVAPKLPELILLLAVSFQACPDFKDRFLEALDHVI